MFAGLIALGITFVCLATWIRNDAIKEGVSEKQAWWFGLIFSGFGTAIGFGVLVLIT